MCNYGMFVRVNCLVGDTLYGKILMTIVIAVFRISWEISSESHLYIIRQIHQKFLPSILPYSGNVWQG